MLSGKEILVIYHADCPDGFGSAYSAWKKFGDTADYFPVLHKTEPPDVSGKEVFTLDYCYQREYLNLILKSAKNLTVIDHHKSNEEVIKIVPEHIFDIEHSATVLSWKYFHPEKDIPKMLLYVEENDLWRFTLPKSKEVSMFIKDLKHDFLFWDKTISEFEDDAKREEFIKTGGVLLKKVNDYVSEAISEGKEVYFEGHKTIIVHSDKYSSEIGNAIAKKISPIGIIWKEEGGKIAVSLRSDGSIDVAKIAEKYGGGGHRSASGFILNKKEDIENLFGVKW